MNERRHGKHSARKTSSVHTTELIRRAKPPENGEGVFRSSPMSISSRREEMKKNRLVVVAPTEVGRAGGERNIKGSVSSASLTHAELVRGGR